MIPKNVLIGILLLTTALLTKSQVRFEAQLGGSNFLGLSLNTAFNIPLVKYGNQYLVPSLGIGLLVPGWDAPTSIIHAGLNYNYNRWGVGTEVSGFTANPFWANENERDFPDMIVYPNANYTFDTKSNWYVKVSAGMLFAFSNSYDNENDRHHLNYEGDAIPGAGLTAGYHF